MKNYRTQDGCWNCIHRAYTMNGLMCNIDNVEYDEEDIVSMLEQ